MLRFWEHVIPTSENIIDSSRTPILLLRARKAGIPTLSYVVTDSVKKIISEFGFPMVIFAVNPFIYEGFKTAKNRSALYRAMKSLGMNYKFPVCVQPLRGEMSSFKSIFGKCEQERRTRRKSLERSTSYSRFRFANCTCRKSMERAYLCGLQPLKKNEICTK